MPVSIKKCAGTRFSACPGIFVYGIVAPDIWMLQAVWLSKPAYGVGFRQMEPRKAVKPGLPSNGGASSAVVL